MQTNDNEGMRDILAKEIAAAPKIRTGVYAILNVTNNKRFISAAVNGLDAAMDEARAALRAGTHVSKHLQHAWRKYGEGAFKFVVLVECPVERCQDEEDRRIAVYQTCNTNYGYNYKPKDKA